MSVEVDGWVKMRYVIPLALACKSRVLEIQLLGDTVRLSIYRAWVDSTGQTFSEEG